MSLEILKKLSSLDAEVRRLTQLHNEVLHGVRRRFLNQMMEWFSMLVEVEGFKIIRAPLGATARLDQTELVLNCTDPSITLQDSEAQYTITCSLSPERSWRPDPIPGWTCWSGSAGRRRGSSPRVP